MDFTSTSITLTEEIGLSIKNFRIKHKITAKEITEHFNRASSYITKLENGTIKKIDVTLLEDICNYITKQNDGLIQFVTYLSSNYASLSDKSKIFVRNLDDVFIKQSIPTELVDEMNSYIIQKGIQIIEIVNKVNENEDIIGTPLYAKMPTNILFSSDDTIDNCAIKFNVEPEYIHSIFNGSQRVAPRIFLEVILYKMYKLGGEEKAREMANRVLHEKKISHLRHYHTKSPMLSNLTANLEPDTIRDLENVTTSLQLITSITEQYGSKGIHKISKNMSTDMGFAFSYMAVDITNFKGKSKAVKQAFINDLRKLIDKYSAMDTPDAQIDLYD